MFVVINPCLPLPYSQDVNPKRFRIIIISDKQVEVESEEGFLKCPFCDEIFAELSDFCTHTNETHKEEVGGWLQCQLCKQHLPNALLLDKVRDNSTD